MFKHSSGEEEMSGAGVARRSVCGFAIVRSGVSARLLRGDGGDEGRERELKKSSVRESMKARFSPRRDW